MNSLSIGICGFGGQGIILSAVIIGTTAVTKKQLYAVQTQSYGSEARGGQCQAELIISERPINSPTAEQKDLLIALSQHALERYLPTLRADGVLIIDPKTVTEVPEGRKMITVEATDTAIRLGNRIAANMVLLGFLSATTELFTVAELMEVVASLVPAKFLGLNRKAVLAGLDLGLAYGGKIG